MDAERDENEQRFWIKVDVRGPDDCWEWKTAPGRDYPGFRWFGKTVTCHKVSWIIAHGDIPENDGYHGTCVLHKCDNRRCVNPAHLFLGTQKQNVEDCHAKLRDANFNGEKSINARLNDKQVRLIRRCFDIGLTPDKLKGIFRVSRDTLYLIKHHRRYKTA